MEGREQRRLHRYGLICTAMLVLAAGCGEGVRDDPVSAARAFMRAANDERCVEAFALYARDTQAAIRHEVHRIRREAEYVQPGLSPETRYCGGSYGTLVRGSERLAWQDGDRARVAMTVSEGSRLALIPFLSTPYRERAFHLDLVRDPDGWKVVREMPRPRTRGRLTEVGPVDVHHPEGGDPLRRSVTAVAPLPVPRESLQRVLGEPSAWVPMLPGLAEWTPAGDSPEGRRLLLRFHGFETPVEVSVRPYGSLVDAKLPWTTVQFNAPRRPGAVLFTGSWKLRPRHDGATWVEFGLVIEPSQWPEEVARRMLLPENAAHSVMQLGAAAGAPGASRP